METAPCPISNSTEFTPWLQVPDRFDATGSVTWNLVRSCASGIIMLNPRPDSSEISLHYKNRQYDPFLNSLNSFTVQHRAYLAARSLLLQYRVNLILKGITKPLQKSTIIEIGCSTGDLLNYLHRKSGIPIGNLTGVEPDKESADYARNIFGLNIFPSLAHEAVRRNKFDRIILWHTLEHIHAINNTLHSVAELLEPDGVLVIALPNPESSDAYHYREDWVAFDAPRHLYHFIPATVEKLLESNRLRVVKQQPYLPDTVYNTYHSETLVCKRQHRSLDLLGIVQVILRASAYAVKGSVFPTTASSLIYFARRA